MVHVLYNTTRAKQLQMSNCVINSVYVVCVGEVHRGVWAEATRLRGVWGGDAGKVDDAGRIDDAGKLDDGGKLMNSRPLLYKAVQT